MKLFWTFLKTPWLWFACASLVWLLAATILNYRLSIPWMDTWCYMAPASFSEGPWDLSRPMLGEFQEASRIWGLHWPGALWISAAVFSLLPDNPLVAVIFLNLAVTAIAWLVLILVGRITGLPWAGAFAGILVFLDKSLALCAGAQRQELLTGFLLLLLVESLTKDRGRLGLALIGLWSALGVLCHPIAFVAIPALPVALFLVRQSPGWAKAAAVWGGCLAGTLIFLLFLFSFGNWPIFSAHAVLNKNMIGEQVILLRALHAFYSTPSGPLLLLAAVLGAPVLIWARRHCGKENFAIAVCYCLLILVFLPFLATHNPFYFVATTPLWLLTAGVIGGFLWKLAPGWVPRIAILILGGGLLWMQSDYWKYRSMYFYQAGIPNLRVEIASIWEEFPEDRQLLVPVLFWESELTSPKGALMASVPYSVTADTQDAYKDYLITKLTPGDVLVVDASDSWTVPIFTQHPERWSLVDEKSQEFSWPANARGWQLKVYEYRP